LRLARLASRRGRRNEEADEEASIQAMQGLPHPRQVQGGGSLLDEGEEVMPGKGLYANIAAKRKRIAAGSGEKMRKPGAKGAPTAKAFKQAAKTAKKGKK
jgi:hypothetical protein